MWKMWVHNQKEIKMKLRINEFEIEKEEQKGREHIIWIRRDYDTISTNAQGIDDLIELLQRFKEKQRILNERGTD